MRFLFSPLLFGLFFSCNPNHHTPYEQKIDDHRNDKNLLFKFDASSPLEKDQKIAFVSLKYFPPDSTYRVVANIEKVNDTGYVKIAYSHGDSEQYKVWAKLNFKLKGKPYQLLAYQSAEYQNDPEYSKNIFVPFYDETNDESTYGGGRYIDLKKPEGDTLILDFNLAYNPYCVYSEEYTCPIPPKENTLPVAIEAGEKKF